MVDSAQWESAVEGEVADPAFVLGSAAPHLSHALPAMLGSICEHLRRVVPEASGVSILLIDGHSTVPAAATSAWVSTFDRVQYARSGPSLAAARSLSHIVVDDFAADPRWRDCASAANAAGVRSMIAVPLVAERVCVGILNAYGSIPDAFGPVAVDEARAFAAYAATAAVAQQIQRANEQIIRQTAEALISRAIIEQAKGAVMVQRQCGPEIAFASLITLSRTTNRKLRDVAGQLVEELSGQSDASKARPLPRDRTHQRPAGPPAGPSSFDPAASSAAPAAAPRKGPTP